MIRSTRTGERSLRRLLLSLLLLFFVLLLIRWACLGDDDLHVATWNIREFPESARQEEAAFEMIHGLGVAAVALQEIEDPARFEAVARQRLGSSWRCEWPDPSPPMHVGVAFDGDAFDLLSTHTYDETMLHPGARPAFEVRLLPHGDDEVLRMIVVHLKAGGNGVSIRRRQLDALRPIVKKAVETDERVVLLGDFNATGDEDRRAIRALADATDTQWATHDLDCTSYWNRDDGCVGTALDHVLASEAPDDVTAHGPCDTEGCGRTDRCPTFWSQVSDHCPVEVDF